MKKFLIIALACVVTGLIPHAAVAQKSASAATVAHIDLDSLLSIMPEFKKATDSLNLMIADLQKTAMQMEQEYEMKRNEYDSLKNIWSATIKALKERQLAELEQNYQLFQQQAQSDVTAKRQALVDPIIKKVKDAIKIVAQREGYRYVIDSSEDSTASLILYSSAADDIFNDVRVQLKIPVPTPAPKPGGAPGSGGAAGGPTGGGK